jgi:tetratricopeptide (TPR) repeat protein
MISKNSSVYDTWRHVFFVYPYWIVMAALGWQYVSALIAGRFTKAGAAGAYIGHGIALLALIPAIAWTVRVHPNQYVYFNELVGGIRGAEGKYELDYYYNSSQQQVKWILKDIPRVPGKKPVALSNMGGFGPNSLHNDTSSLGVDYQRFSGTDTRYWDYYMLFPRLLPEGLIKNKAWLPSSATHVVSVDGVPLSAVIKRVDSFDLVAGRAMQEGNLPLAAENLSKVVAKDPRDYNAWMRYGQVLASMNRLPEAVSAFQQVLKLNPEDLQAMEILVKIYGALGDASNAQLMQGRMMEVNTELQESYGEAE